MIRKIIKIGNSEGITIPVSTIKAHKLNVGDHIEVLLNPPGETARLLEVVQQFERFNKSLPKGEEIGSVDRGEKGHDREYHDQAIQDTKLF